MLNNQLNRSIAIGFVIYNHESEFSSRLISILHSGYVAYIFDNSPEISLTRDEFRDHPNVRYFCAGKNVGLGFGLSVICANAYLDKFKTLLFFDQDTIFSLKTLDFVGEFYLDKQEIYKDYAAVLFKGSIQKTKNQFDIKNEKLIISSGSLFNLESLRNLNWHNTNYFVDGVDYEFCLRANRNKYLIGICYNAPDFDHISGQEDRVYNIFNSKLFLRAYNNRRMLDIFISFNRLIATSIWNFKVIYAFLFLKAIMVTFSFQFLVRILNIYEHNNRKQ